MNPVPKDEYSRIGSAESAIDEIDHMVAASLLDKNIPKCYLDIVGKHCTLLNAVTQSCPTNHGITIYEASTQYLILMRYLLLFVSAYDILASWIARISSSGSSHHPYSLL